MAVATEVAKEFLESVKGGGLVLVIWGFPKIVVVGFPPKSSNKR